MTEIRPVIFRGKKIEGYFASEDGKIFRNYKVLFGRKVSLDKLIESKGHKRQKCIEIKITFPRDLFDYEYAYKNSKRNDRSQLTVSAHQLIMETFRPVDLYPPERLKKVWNKLPKEAKEWIRETIIINHINHNPYDNRLSNLEYVTPRENSHKAVEFYDGNVANKKKLNENVEKEPETNLEVFMN